MKNFLITLILTFAIFISAPSYVFAETKAGIKPGNFWYSFDLAFEKINLFFTFKSESKARKALQYADERLAEAKEVAENKNTDAVKMAISNYEDSIAFVAEKSKDISEKEKAEALLASITDNTTKHQEILNDVLAKVPDEAKGAIKKAIDASRNGQKEAMKQIAELRGEVEQLKKEIEELKNTDDSNTVQNSNVNSPATEIEKLKREVENLKNQKITPPSTDIIQQLPKQTTTQEAPKQLQNYDQELSQMIAKAKERIGIFNEAVNETEKFIPIVRSTMNKYAGDSLVQSSGQELINENNNLASISRKLVSIETQRVNKLSSYLGLGVLPSVSDFSSIVQDYNNYYKQYETSNGRIESLMRTFVANEKSALESKLAEERQELDELKKLLSQEIAARQKQLTDLGNQIDSYQAQYDKACEGVTMSACAGIRAEIASKMNPLIDQYNTLLGNNSGKIYSPVRQTYLRFEADQFGRGGRLYDPNGSTYYTFDCDQWSNCSIYGQ